MVRADWAGGQGIRSFGGQPLRDGNEVLGVLAVFTHVRLDREGQDWLETIAEHAAAALINARAFEELERRNRGLEHGARQSTGGNRFRRIRSERDRRRRKLRAAGAGHRGFRASKTVVPDVELRRREKANVMAALEQTRWKIYGPGGAAELLGVKPTTLASRVRKMGLVERTWPRLDSSDRVRAN